LTGILPTALVLYGKGPGRRFKKMLEILTGHEVLPMARTSPFKQGALY
jgi:hypothetical protein